MASATSGPELGISLAPGLASKAVWTSLGFTRSTRTLWRRSSSASSVMPLRRTWWRQGSARDP
jgi:hypothetical protein